MNNLFLLLLQLLITSIAVGGSAMVGGMAAEAIVNKQWLLMLIATIAIIVIMALCIYSIRFVRKIA